MAPTRGCWTCKDRRVSCDRTRPRCLKCLRGKRVCGGYGVRLTWQPSEYESIANGHSRNAAVDACLLGNDFDFINVVPADVRLHLTATDYGSSVTKSSKTQLTLPNPTDFSLVDRTVIPTTNDELLYYFESTVMDLVPTMFVDRDGLQRFIMRSARSDRGSSSRAVLNSVLALACHHRGDSRVLVDNFRQKAISQLLVCTGVTTCQASEHIVANMLLSVLAMQLTDQCNSAWIGHVCSVKEVLHVFADSAPSASEYTSIILGWAYQYDIMVRFSLRHWRTNEVRAFAEDLGFEANEHAECALQFLFVLKSFAKKVPSVAEHAHPVLRLLAEVSDTIVSASNPHYFSEEYQNYLDDLRGRLERVKSTAVTRYLSTSEEQVIKTDSEIELTRLAALIYLERVSRNFSGKSAQIEVWTRKATSIMRVLDSCKASFALLVIGCEATDDQDRMEILQLYARTLRKPCLSHLANSRALIETAWNHRDLQEDGEVNYMGMLNLVLSTRDVVPSFI